MNDLYCGDNLEIMANIPGESVDLVYIDPPFFTSKKYEVIWGDNAEIRAFEDRWVKTGEKGKYSKDMNVYLDFMEPRLKEIYRILKPTGSFYLHCDWHADAYLRITCDMLFGREPLNVITWKRTSKIKGTSNGYSKNADTIYIYTKSNEFNLKVQKMSLSETQIQRDYKAIEKDTDRIFNHGGLLLPGNSPKELIINNKTYIAPNGKRFRWNQDTLDSKLKENPNILHWTKGDYPRYKIYLDEHEGIPITCIWDDIDELSTNSAERLGYPTQKPEALLERIILTSSREEDVIMDSFCGCGTTLAVCKRLKRQYIGIDISPTACRLIATRIHHSLSTIIGLPLSSVEIETLSGFEFQNAVIRALDPSLTTIKIGGKGADGGIDGSYYDVLISVKKYRAGRVDLDQFIATLYRNEKKKGIFIALGYSADFIKEVSRLKREQKITIHSFTLAEIIDERKHECIISEENRKHGKLM